MACPSEVTQEDVDKWAFECYQSHHYTNGWDDDYKYRCPGCDENFTKVSGLFQHIETPACDSGYHGSLGKLQKYIEKKVQSFCEG
jgi:hypothetical protein